MLAHYCDGHCILVEEETKNASNEKGGEKESDAIVLLAAVELLQNTIFVATKAKRDWKVMIECLRQSRKEWNQAFSIGIHPWYVEEATKNDSLQQMEQLLKDNPTLRVGEIGLDKIAARRSPLPSAFDLQVSVFEDQLRLASIYERSVSIHCVDCFGVLLTCLNKQSNRGIKSVLLHSYSGSVETTKRILKEIALNVYFGFSYKINSKIKNIHQIIASVPKDKIIIESDLPSTNEERYASLNKALSMCGISNEEMKENFDCFINNS